MKKFLYIALAAVILLLLFLIISCTVPPAFQRRAELEKLAEYKSEPASGERVLCVDDNLDALLWRLRIIEEAKEEIIFSTFDLADDDSGRTVMSALYAAAKRGVSIKILVDGLNGQMKLENCDAFCALASHPLVEARLYGKLNLTTPWTVNYRMHDKYIISDRRAYIFGGRNTRDLFLGEPEGVYNIDRDIMVYGGEKSASAEALANYFARVFDEECCTPLSGELGERRLAAGRTTLEEKYTEAQSRYPSAFGYSDFYGSTVPANEVSLLFGETHNGNKAPIMWENILALAAGADEVLIETPYIVLNEKMYEDLRTLDGGGTRVAIMTNAVESGANPWGCTDYMNQKGNILATGVEIYEYMGEQSLHTKAVLIGDSLSLVGSYNLDMRSTYLDTELMLAIDCPELNATLRETFDGRAEASKHIFPNGTETAGEKYEERALEFPKSIWYFILRTAMLLLRHLA